VDPHFAQTVENSCCRGPRRCGGRCCDGWRETDGSLLDGRWSCLRLSRCLRCGAGCGAGVLHAMGLRYSFGSPVY